MRYTYEVRYISGYSVHFSSEKKAKHYVLQSYGLELVKKRCWLWLPESSDSEIQCIERHWIR